MGLLDLLRTVRFEIVCKTYYKARYLSDIGQHLMQFDTGGTKHTVDCGDCGATSDGYHTASDGIQHRCRSYSCTFVKPQ